VVDCEFHVNKALLSKKSSFFEAMFNRNWRENSQSKEGQPIYLSELDAYICKTIFHFLYTSKLVLPGVTDDTAFFTRYTELMNIAFYFGIEEDMELGIGKYLKKLLTKKTVFHIWELTYLAGSEILTKECEKFLINNFPLACESSEFFFCSKELLRRILSSGDIDCDPDYILEKIKLWARFNMYREQEHFTELAEKKYIMDLLPPQTFFAKTLKRALLSCR